MSGSSGQKRGGLQVVKVSQKPGQRYDLDEEALASVLLRPDIRNLPVVVVSVAGAYRGGKSFILDFFLRYLMAPRENQLTGEWLGKEDDLLEGFDWRGGGECNTKGIHLWPEPVIVTIEQTRQKVAVLLMDTQGTFDTESDMGDNSTIFALSTLLSSVQIYNIRANIGEDDLQHLQLFTDYGRLACNAEGKAFQTLLFLIRDWMSPYEHEHGYVGGDALMNKRLQPKPNQKKQLLEVREHIHSCFVKLQCFLMPHPGLLVGKQDFRGLLRDITEEFRSSLLELVPSLFDQSNLIPKTINGNTVQAQGLLEFFKQYVAIFNSDDLPEATTIYQATANACMMAVLREARACYDEKMDTKIIEDQSVSTSIMENWHRAAVETAVSLFQEKKKFGSQETFATHLADLEKELGARFSMYLWHNDAKVRDTLSEAKKKYEDTVGEVCEEQAHLCLHANDLRALHLKAVEAALDIFDKTRTQVPRETDKDRAELNTSFEQHYQHLCIMNAQNNRNAALEAREKYLSQMKDSVNQKGVSTEELKSQHDKALKAALKHFQTYRNQVTKETKDPDLEHLQEEIETYFVQFEKENAHKNLWAMQIAEFTYNNHVTSAWGPQSCCFHPIALLDLHNEAQKKALEQFLSERVESANDDYKAKLIAKLEDRFAELQKINQFNNIQVKNQAFAEYTRRMDKHSQPGLSSILIAPFIIKTFVLLPQHHETARKKALDIFNERRRGQRHDSNDQYLSDLKQKIDDAYENYKDPIKAIIRELGIQNMLPSGLLN